MAHTPTPWRVEEGAGLIWGACNPDDRTTWGMGYPVARIEHPHQWHSGRLPTPDEQDANAALIVRAVNCHAELVEVLENVIADPIGCAANDYAAARAILAKATAPAI